MIEDGIGIGAIVMDVEERTGEVTELLGTNYVNVLWDDEDWPSKYRRDELEVLEDAPEEMMVNSVPQEWDDWYYDAY